jgi:hypothetical protein
MGESEDPVMLHLDTPVDGTNVPRSPFLVAGWALDPRAPLVAVLVGIDRRRWAPAEMGIRRPDVGAAFPRFGGARRAGWRTEFDLTDWPRDEIEIMLVALRAGRTAWWEMPARVRLRPR